MISRQGAGWRAASRVVRLAYAGACAFVIGSVACVRPAERADDRHVDVLLRGGRVIDGAGNPWVTADVGIRGERIVFVGRAGAHDVTARDTVDVSGKLVTPGFWDVHSHADLSTPEGRALAPLLHQGVTTILLGADGHGPSDLEARLREPYDRGVSVNALFYVGHNAARAAVMGNDFGRAATADEVSRMRTYVDEGMRRGAIGFSTGLAYNPGFYASTDEVVLLAEVAAGHGGVYDTHDRDMGASYGGIGYLPSVREGIEIAERAGLPLIFSHFSPLGAAAARALPDAIALIDAARARGVDVMAGQHVYTASSSGFVAHTLPRWAAVGGGDALRKRLDDDESWARLRREIPEVLAMRGGAEKIVVTDGSPALSGRSLAAIAADWNVDVPEAVRRIVREGGDGVYDMNLDIYDAQAIRLLATKDWMMTCTDGFLPASPGLYSHPRSFGTFTRKLRQFVLDEPLLSLPFAIRGMSSLPAVFFGIPDRGLVRPGFIADLAVFDEREIRDLATYDAPTKLSRGTVHVLVNGVFALRNGTPTAALPGRLVPRPTRRLTPDPGASAFADRRPRS